MRTSTFSVFALLFIAAAPAPEDPVADELKKLQGTWIMESCVFNGMDLLKDSKELKTEFIIEKKSYRIAMDGKLCGTFTIDPSKSPKTVDRTDGEEGDDKGKVYLGIYELDGDRLKLCSSLSEKIRPKEFTGDQADEPTGDDSGKARELIVFKRKK
ncbi:MAG TPA: TIGR03067 domain-containing protein [Gemmataceae bacterium]|jgi:uncharacterized protein (TIGR03067 family)|nr:TIGR03067 domain-containing protein [Gemmataceae bacterium]